MQKKYLLGVILLSSISFVSFAKLMPNEKVSDVQTTTLYVNFDKDGKITGQKKVFDRSVIPHTEMSKEQTAQLAQKALSSIKDKETDLSSSHHDFDKNAEVMTSKLEGNPLPLKDNDVGTLVSTSIKVVNADDKGNVTRHEHIKSNAIFSNGNHDQGHLKKIAAIAHQQIKQDTNADDNATLGLISNLTDFVKAATSGVSSLAGGVAGALGNAAKGAVMGLLVP